MIIRRRCGFTLLEVLVAIVVAAGVLGLARATLLGVTDGAGRMAAATSAMDDIRTSRQLLRDLFAFARTGGRDSVTFIGSARALFIRGYCPAPGGWRESCSITLSIGDSSQHVYVGIDLRPPAAIDTTARARASLCYLKSAADGGLWVADWAATSELPLAIGLVIDRDTTILPVGR